MPKLVIDTDLTSMSEEVKKAMREQVMQALYAIGSEAEGYAKDECPVDTGTLRNSISNAVEESELAVYIGTNVEYAVYVEYGEKARHETGKAHFLRDSATTHGERYKELLELFLKE